jgi:hypothetical protein
MPYYAFTNFDEENATYTGFRMVEADWELGENETLVEADSLDGYTEAVPNLPKTPQEKLQELTALILTLDNATQKEFLPTSRDVFVVLQAGNVSLAVDIVEDVDVTGDANKEALKNAILEILNS